MGHLGQTGAAIPSIDIVDRRGLKSTSEVKLSAETLRAEFEGEARTTRRYLERVPEDEFEWRPHRKSFTLKELASHIVECVRWTDAIFSGDEFNVDPATFRPFLAASVAELLDAFDANVAKGMHAMTAAGDSSLALPWRMKIKGAVRFERPKVMVFRDFTLSHLIHHRGQMSVYLRLLDVPVPGAYGPTADEQS